MHTSGTPRSRTNRRNGAAVALVLGSTLLTACPVEVPVDPTTTTTSTTSTTTTTTAAPLPVCPAPDAPVLSIISELETLPFTIPGGGPIEVALLDEGTDLAAASWTTTSSVPLSGRSGATRVVARSAATDCAPTQLFDATYDVRPLYAPRSGTPGSPALLPSDPAFSSWASGYVDYTPGADVTVGFQTPANAVGAYGTDVVVLGHGGRITLTFDTPISDGDGDDLAVFENGFAENPTSQNLFCELAYVEVSSDGVTFARFDSASRQATPVAAFGFQSAELLGGVAGKDLGGYGTPFDLSTLRNDPLVRSGAVDLEAITHVRLRDIVGANDYPNPGDTYPDSFGRQILDSHKATGSGGFDLRAVGALHQG